MIPALTRLRHATCRWLAIITLAIVGAVEFHLILPLVWPWVRSINLRTPRLSSRSQQYLPLSWPSTLSWTRYVFAVANGPHSRGTRHSGFPLCLPAPLPPGPTACPSPCVPIPCHPTGNSHTSFCRSPASSCSRWLCGNFHDPRHRNRARNLAVRPPTSAPRVHGPGAMSMTGSPPTNSRLTASRQDLFGRAPVANRIAEALRESRSVALLGAFGTGRAASSTSCLES